MTEICISSSKSPVSAEKFCNESTNKSFLIFSKEIIESNLCPCADISWLSEYLIEEEVLFYRSIGTFAHHGLDIRSLIMEDNKMNFTLIDTPKWVSSQSTIRLFKLTILTHEAMI